MMPTIIRQQTTVDSQQATSTNSPCCTPIFNSSKIEEMFKFFKEIYDSNVFQNISHSSSSSIFSFVCFIFILVLILFVVIVFVYFFRLFKKKTTYSANLRKVKKIDFKREFLLNLTNFFDFN